MPASSCSPSFPRALFGALCLALCLGVPGAAHASGLRAGTGRASFAPNPAHLKACVYLGGYGGFRQRGCAEGVRDGVGARALALEAEGRTVVFVILDAVGAGNAVLDAIRQRASALTGVPEDALLVGATHTHGGPDLQGLWGGVNAQYLDFLVEKSVAAITQALGGLKPATLHAGGLDVPQELVANRRGWGFTDTRMTVLQLRAAANDKVLATLVNLAVHPTVLNSGNRLMATDFVGALNDGVEARFGGLSLFFNGAQGDAVPVDPPAADEYAAADAYGETLAGLAAQALEGAAPVPAGLHLVTRPQTFTVDNPAFVGAYLFGLLSPYYVMRTGVGPSGVRFLIDSRLVRVRLGDATTGVELVSLPGEATTRLGLDLRALLSGTEEVLLGLDHDTLGYLIPADEFGTGRNRNYEESVSLGPRAGETVRAAVQWLVQQ